MVELVDTLALGASAARREGSSPFIRTKQSTQQMLGFLLLLQFFARSQYNYSYLYVVQICII